MKIKNNTVFLTQREYMETIERLPNIYHIDRPFVSILVMEKPNRRDFKNTNSICRAREITFQLMRDWDDTRHWNIKEAIVIVPDEELFKV